MKNPQNECKYVLFGKIHTRSVIGSNPIDATMQETQELPGFLFLRWCGNDFKGLVFGVFVPRLFRTLPANSCCIRLFGHFWCSIFVP